MCGDDKGSLWLYNMPGMVNSSPDKSPEPIKKLVDPTTKLVWPELQVFGRENFWLGKRKLMIGRFKFYSGHNLEIIKEIFQKEISLSD